MAKDWWFKFEFHKWRNDSSLRRCSLETKGFWLECICVMREIGSDRLTGSYAEIARMVGCFPEEAARCIVELRRTETARVTLGNDCVTLVSRYISKEIKAKKQTKLRVRKHRSNANVTVDVTDRVISKSKELKKEKKEEGEAPAEQPEPRRSDFDPPQHRPAPLHGHPVIEALRIVTKRNPKPEARQHLISKVGGEIDLAKLHIAFGEWSARGYKDTNFDGILDWYLGKKHGTTKQPSEREKSAQRTINAELMADAIGRGDEAALRRILEGGGQDHSKGYLPS